MGKGIRFIGRREGGNKEVLTLKRERTRTSKRNSLGGTLFDRGPIAKGKGGREMRGGEGKTKLKNVGGDGKRGRGGGEKKDKLPSGSPTQNQPLQKKRRWPTKRKKKKKCGGLKRRVEGGGGGKNEEEA